MVLVTSMAASVKPPGLGLNLELLGVVEGLGRKKVLGLISVSSSFSPLEEVRVLNNKAALTALTEHGVYPALTGLVGCDRGLSPAELSGILESVKTLSRSTNGDGLWFLNA